MSDQSTFMLSGASGYLSSWVCKYLLEAGHNVHATVRSIASSEKCSHLQKLKEAFPESLHFFEADLLVEGSFKEAMQNCDYVIHTASPFFTESKDPENELIKPAVEGTRSILQTVNETPSVKRVVLTSSMAAIKGDAQDAVDAGGTVDETHWNTTSSVDHNPYFYSKLAAEQAAWEIAKQQDRWDLVTICPGFNLGPSLSDRVDTTSVSFMRDLLNGKMPLAPDFYIDFVDVRDCARAHVLAATTPEANGRYLTVATVNNLMGLVPLLKPAYANYPLPKATIPKIIFMLIGKIAAGYTLKMTRLNYGISFKANNQRSIDGLKLEYNDLKKTLSDHAEQLIESGLVKKR